MNNRRKLLIKLKLI